MNFAGFATSFTATFPSLAQETRTNALRVLTAADYARAEKFMPYKTTPLVLHAGVRAT